MEQIVVTLFLVFFSLEFLVEFTLNEKNMGYVRERWADKKVPDFFRNSIDPENYKKSVEYTLAKGRFERWAEVYGRVIVLIILFGGALPYLDRLSQNLGGHFSPSMQVTGISFCFSIAMIFSVLSFPADLYSTFVIEERFGFNKSTLKLYLTDKLKGLVIGTVIGIPFLFGVLWLMKATGSNWWIWAFLFIFAFQCLGTYQTG